MSTRRIALHEGGHGHEHAHGRELTPSRLWRC